MQSTSISRSERPSSPNRLVARVAVRESRAALPMPNLALGGIGLLLAGFGNGNEGRGHRLIALSIGGVRVDQQGRSAGCHALGVVRRVAHWREQAHTRPLGNGL